MNRIHLAKINFALMLGLILSACSGSDEGFSYRFSENDGAVYHQKDLIGNVRNGNSPGIESTDEIRQAEDGVFLWKRTFSNISGKRMDSVRLTMDFEVKGKSGFQLIPAVSYNGNLHEKHNLLKGYSKNGTPWTFAYHRIAVPGATYTETGNWSVTLFGEAKGEFEPFSCSLIPEEKRTTHRLIWPEEELPYTNYTKNKLKSGYRQNLTLEKDGSLTVTAWLVVAPNKKGHRSIDKMLDVAWKIHRHDTKAAFPVQHVWDYGVAYAKNGLWHKIQDFEAFNIGMRYRPYGENKGPENGKTDEFHLENGEWTNVLYTHFEAGWAGQNISLANSLFTDFLKHGDSTSLKKAITSLDGWIKYCVPKDEGQIISARFWGNGPSGGTDACNMGTAGRNFIEAYHLAKKCGVNRPEYLKAGLAIADFAVKEQQPGGVIGKSWNINGKCTRREGTTGAFMIPAMMAANKETGKEVYLEASKRAFSHYYSTFEEKGYTTAGALDSDCVDKESSFPMLRSAMLLFETTQDKTYLDKAVAISYYLASWQWHQSVDFGPKASLTEYGHDTFGGTSVSTQHQHMDPYALYWVSDWIKLAKYTGNDLWRERAIAAWNHGTFSLSDGSKIFNDKRRPTGSQNEAFFHTSWGWGDATFGSMNDWLVAWPTAFRLETLRYLDDWNVLEAEQEEKLAKAK
ncbi:hypothetical protein FUAX_52330 (plasmid) [Fulvitalea axinellae]|uniref:Cellulase Ig-like domain-containing protein n=1 Tax=Fulvitalea axinellae TaxID=1182444 RepID=A0AAU9CLB1_9BACT|nr:hypothetical protein FUAX_52330 [Fulvitalea axinellae]